MYKSCNVAQADVLSQMRLKFKAAFWADRHPTGDHSTD
jgi:hypothetical protein